MYPVLFRIGEFEVTSFGVLVGVGALVGLWLFGRELARSGLPPEASNAAVAGVFGGLLGAKLVWTAEFMGNAPVADLLFSRGGLSWFGGLLGVQSDSPSNSSGSLWILGPLTLAHLISLSFVAGGTWMLLRRDRRPTF